MVSRQITRAGFSAALFLMISTAHIAVEAAPAPQPTISSEDAAKFSAYAEQTAYTVEHRPFSQFLQAVVLDIGPSTRDPAPRRSGGVHTGTRVSTGSRTKYRYEGNRILFHLFTDETTEFLQVYRSALTGLMDKYDYAKFGRNEQLAFWLNLHNAVLIEEIAKRYPISKPAYIRVRDADNAMLFDAKIIEVNGVKMSLNDIRYGIVYRYWSDKPNVIYGFWDGSIGGVDIAPEAFSSTNLDSLLEENGRRYVNALRGVDKRSNSFRVSEIYQHARIFFPNWPNDLYQHLRSLANDEVFTILAPSPAQPRFLPFDVATADLSSGEVAKFGGSDNIAAVLTLRPENGDDIPVDILESFGAPITNNTMRGGVSADSFKLNQELREKRAKQRGEGKVTIDDIDTEDPADDVADDSENDDASDNEGSE